MRGTNPPLSLRLMATAPAPIGLPVGAPAPTFALQSLAENRATVTLGDLLNDSKPTLLLFMDPGCGPCTAMLPEVVQWQQQHFDCLKLAIVCRGNAKENRKKFGHVGLRLVLMQEGYEVSQPYSALGTPSVVLIRADGRIGSSVAAGADAIGALVAQAALAAGAVRAGAPDPKR